MKLLNQFAWVVAGPSAAMTLLTGSAVANEWSFQPRGSIGYQNYSFEFSDDVESDLNIFDVDVDVANVIGGAGLSIQYGRFFVDVYGQTTLTDNKENTDISSGLGINVTNSVDRKEINLTSGYAINNYVSLFSGFKYSGSEVDQGFSNSINAELDVSYYGPYLGGVLSLPVAEVGTLAFSSSVAYLFGELDSSASVGGITAESEESGKSLGISAGLFWVGNFGIFTPAANKLGYSVGVDYSYYEFDSDSGDDELFSEESLRGKLDLSYRF